MPGPSGSFPEAPALNDPASPANYDLPGEIKKMKRFQSMLFASLLTLAVSVTALAGDIHGVVADGDIHGFFGDIHGFCGSVIAFFVGL